MKGGFVLGECYFFGVKPKLNEKPDLGYLFKHSSDYGSWSDAKDSDDKKDRKNLSESSGNCESFCRDGGGTDD